MGPSIGEDCLTRAERSRRREMHFKVVAPYRASGSPCSSVDHQSESGARPCRVRHPAASSRAERRAGHCATKRGLFTPNPRTHSAAAVLTLASVNKICISRSSRNIPAFVFLLLAPLNCDVILKVRHWNFHKLWQKCKNKGGVCICSNYLYSPYYAKVGILKVQEGCYLEVAIEAHKIVHKISKCLADFVKNIWT